MNVAARIPAREYDTATYAADSWVCTEETLQQQWEHGAIGGFGVDERANPVVAHIRTRSGAWERVVLNVPLCKCGAQIVNHVCHDCCQVFLGEPLV